MVKPEWGIKRLCQSCGSRYYDFLRTPIVCPSCGTTFDSEAVLKSRRARPLPVDDVKPKARKEADPDVEAVEEEEEEDDEEEALDEGEIEEDVIEDEDAEADAADPTAKRLPVDDIDVDDVDAVAVDEEDEDLAPIDEVEDEIEPDEVDR